MDLRRLAFKGIRWTAISMIFVTIGSLVQLYILVRYIDESDFGLMALVNVIITFALTFLDFGVSNGIIHKKEISATQLSTLYWLTVIMGSVLTLLIFIFSPLFAFFYAETELTQLLQIIAIVFFINSFGHPFRVLMNKNMKFDQLARITIFSFILSFIIVVYLAMEGRGVYALVYGLLARTICETFLAAWLGWKDYQLDFTFQPKTIGFFVKFGSFQMADGLVSFFTRQFDVILIGKILGTDILGVYDVIKRFLMRPYQAINPIITGVSFPLMSKIQDEEERLKEVYLRQLNYLCVINFPIYAFLFFHASDIILFMFGEDWLGYEKVFQLLTIAYAIMSTGNPVGSLLLAKGRADLGFYWNLGMFLIIPLMIYISGGYGLEMIAWALALFQLFIMIPNYRILVRRLIKVKGWNYFRQILFPLTLSILMGLITFGTAYLIDAHLILRLLILFVVGSLSYLALNYLFNRRFINDFFGLIKL